MSESVSPPSGFLVEGVERGEFQRQLLGFQEALRHEPAKRVARRPRKPKGTRIPKRRPT